MNNVLYLYKNSRVIVLLIKILQKGIIRFYNLLVYKQIDKNATP